jgi:hypothetical protein
MRYVRLERSVRDARRGMEYIYSISTYLVSIVEPIVIVRGEIGVLDVLIRI